MHEVFCHHCDRRYVMGSGAIISLHNTSEGPVAYTKCPVGHRLVRYFRTGATVPAPTASDLAA